MFLLILELPPDVQAVLNREIPGNGNGEFIALGGAGIGERHSNGLRNGWDGNPATRGMPVSMQGGFQQDQMLGDFGHDGGMHGGHGGGMHGGHDGGMHGGHGGHGGQIMQGGFQQDQFDVPPIGQANIHVPFVDGMTGQFDNFQTGPFLNPGQDNFVPISSVMGGDVASLGGYGRRYHPKKPTIPPKKQTILPKKPVMNPKKPISYSKKPQMQHKNPFYPKRPVIHPKKPIIKPMKPTIHHKRPIINPIKPIINPKKPIIRPMKPVISPKMSINYPKKPSILPINYPKKPIMHPKKSPIYPKQPAMKSFGHGGYGRIRTRGKHFIFIKSLYPKVN
jgi:hypothetical protein